MSWAEFRAVFSWLGFAGLAFGVAHQAMWGAIIHKHRPNPSFWVGDGTIVRVCLSSFYKATSFTKLYLTEFVF